jgi:hypothetical protein
MQYEILEFPRHRDVKVGSGLALDQIGGLNHCWIGLSEISEAACDYPLVFMKSSETGKFRLVALFGLQPDFNLFVLDSHYIGTYLPMQLSRAPFALSQNASGQLVAAIDMKHPRANDPTGAALFDHVGADTAFTVNLRALLARLVGDQEATLGFIEAIASHNLLTPMPVDLDYVGNQELARLDGLYTIHCGQLAALGDASVLELNRRGYLRAAHVVSGSLAQFVRLQQLHNAHAARNSKIAGLEKVVVGLPE